MPQNIGFTAGNLEKKTLKKINCGRWTENVLTLSDTISSKRGRA